jgi:hypothetical protein
MPGCGMPTPHSALDEVLEKKCGSRLNQANSVGTPACPVSRAKMPAKVLPTRPAPTMLYFIAALHVGECVIDPLLSARLGCGWLVLRCR